MGNDVRDEILPFCQMSRYLGKAQDRDELLLADRLPHLPALNDDELRHAAAVDGAEVEREEEARLGVEKATSRQTRPDGVAEKDQCRVAHNSRVISSAAPVEGLRESPILVHEHVLDVEVHAAHALFPVAGALDEAIEERGQGRRRLVAKALAAVRLPGKEVVHAELTLVAVGADGQHLLQHAACGVPCPLF